MVRRLSSDITRAATAYVLVACAVTWPVVSGLARDVPWDMGDPVLNMWIVAWDAENFLRALGGNLDALRNIWDANIYHPSRLSLAYSEHLFPQALQILPVYAVTRNPILCYNLLLLSTSVLSALTMFALVRHVTGSASAGFIAGLVFGFAPYRIAQYSHLQVLSAQWMPLAILAVRRLVETRTWRWTAILAAATIAQALSCGYYLLFFTPFVAAYVVYELARNRALVDRGLVLKVAVAGFLTAAVVIPISMPYATLRYEANLVRAPWEVRHFSADVYSYATAHPENRLWGRVLQTYPKPEGELFPGLTAALLAVAGVFSAWRRRNVVPANRRDRLLHVARLGALIVAGLAAAAVVWVLLTGRAVVWLGSVKIGVSRIWRSVAICVAALLCARILSRRAAAAPADHNAAPVQFAIAGVLAAAVLSFGPVILSRGRTVAFGPYAWLHRYVPGFDGLRVPARFAMIVMLFIALLAGIGAAALLRRAGRRRVLVTAVLSVAVVIESNAAPIPVNGWWEESEIASPGLLLRPGNRAPPIYRSIDKLPEQAVLVHFPFGYEQYELRYMFYSTVHWRRLLNGYSGGSPALYRRHRTFLMRPLSNPTRAWDFVRDAGATHAVVHTSAFLGDEGERVVAWLTEHGAVEVERQGSDVLLALRR